MPLTVRVEPPTDSFVIPTSVARFTAWLKEHLRALLGGAPDGAEFDFLILREINEELTESGSLHIDVHVAGVNMYFDMSTGENDSEMEEFPHYLTFLLIEMEQERTEVWARYGPATARYDYETIKSDIISLWPQRPKQPKYQLEWPRIVSRDTTLSQSPGTPHRKQTTLERKRRPPGRPRNEVDEWARREVWLNGQSSDQIYIQWKRRVDPQRLNTMADPRDSFGKLMRKRPKEGDDVA